MKKVHVIHPFMFAIFPVLFLLSYNVEQVSFSGYEIMVPMAIVLGFTVLLMLTLGFILKDFKKAGIVTSIFLVLFFSYGHFFNSAKDWQVYGCLIVRHRYLMPIWCALIVLGSYFVLRTRKNLVSVTKTLNVLALSLVAISVVNIVVYQFRTVDGWRQNDLQVDSNRLGTVNPADVAKLPDIYYIILDGHASSRTLKEIYNYDNHEFTDHLISKGFYVAGDSRANYPFTRFALATSLNMKYPNDAELENWPRLGEMIKNSKVMNFLQSKGYKAINFSSGWGPTAFNPYADTNVWCGVGSELMIVLIQTTMILPFDTYFGFLQRNKVLSIFEKLADIPKLSGPTFSFAHILSPHFPYVFGANGEVVVNTKLFMSGYSWEQSQNYLDQLIFIDKKVRVLIDEILSSSDIPPIIIVQSDHGPDLTLGSPWSDHPTKNMLKERMTILNTYYLPSGGKEKLYESITPVNTFRLIFNSYFDANYKLLDDVSYYATFDHLDGIVDVTHEMKGDLASSH